MLFRVKDKVTGKIYDDPYKLCQEAGKHGDFSYKEIFRPHQFILDNDGDLFIVNTMDDVYPLPKQRFKVLWNFKHKMLRDVVKYGF